MPKLAARSTEALRQAFADDGFDVILEVEHDGHRGLLAESRTAFNANTTQKKRAYYVEGDPFTLGWLMGRMAEQQVAIMTERYLPNLVPALIAKDHVPDAGRHQ